MACPPGKMLASNGETALGAAILQRQGIKMASGRLSGCCYFAAHRVLIPLFRVSVWHIILFSSDIIQYLHEIGDAGSTAFMVQPHIFLQCRCSSAAKKQRLCIKQPASARLRLHSVLSPEATGAGNSCFPFPDFSVFFFWNSAGPRRFLWHANCLCHFAT